VADRSYQGRLRRRICWSEPVFVEKRVPKLGDQRVLLTLAKDTSEKAALRGPKIAKIVLARSSQSPFNITSAFRWRVTNLAMGLHLRWAAWKV
jgi:hypothetical protein